MNAVWTFFLLLAGATLAPAASASEEYDAWRKPVLDVTFSYDRFASADTAGCSIRSLGGLDREADLLKRLSRTSTAAHLVVGTTFVPAPENLAAASVRDARTSAADVARGLGTLRTFAVAPSADDFWLGGATLEKLRRKHSLRFLASNLSSRFVKTSPRLTMKTPAGSVVFLALVRGPDAAYGKVSDVAWTAPATALAREVAALPSNVAGLVIATNLDVTERRRLVVDRNLAVVWIGGPEADEALGAWQLDAQTLQGTVLDMGRMVGRRLVELSGRAAVLDLGQAAYWQSVAKDASSADQTLAKSLAVLTPADARVAVFRRYPLEPSKDFAKAPKH